VAAASDATGLLRVGTPAEMAGAATRSHLPDGRCVGWYGPVPRAGVALDAEYDVEPPPSLVARHGRPQFWERWTLVECAAKLYGVPVAMWLRQHGLAVPAGLLHARTLRPTGLVGRAGAAVVVTVARRAGAVPESLSAG